MFHRFRTLPHRQKGAAQGVWIRLRPDADKGRSFLVGFESRLVGLVEYSSSRIGSLAGSLRALRVNQGTLLVELVDDPSSPGRFTLVTRGKAGGAAEGDVRLVWL